MLNILTNGIGDYLAVAKNDFDFLDRLNFDYKIQERPNILIIDDDIDSLIPIDIAFRQFNCSITMATEAKDAIKKITSGKPDVIILDWLVENQTGDRLVKFSLEKIEKFNNLKKTIIEKHPIIITYSGKQEDELSLPENKYYKYLDHWQKPLRFNHALLKVSNLLNKLGY